MNRITVSPFVRSIAGPVGQILLGLLLLFRPDAISSLAGVIVGWIALIAGIALALILLPSKNRTLSQAFFSLVLVLLGSWLLKDPLRLASNLTRMVGVLLLCGGRVSSGSSLGQNLLFGAPILLGLILLFLPISASRLVFKLVGLGVLIAGGLELADRLHSGPKPGDKPHIIDAE